MAGTCRSLRVRGRAVQHEFEAQHNEMWLVRVARSACGAGQYSTSLKRNTMRCDWYVSLAPRAGQGSTARVTHDQPALVARGARGGDRPAGARGGSGQLTKKWLERAHQEVVGAHDQPALVARGARGGDRSAGARGSRSTRRWSNAIGIGQTPRPAGPENPKTEVSSAHHRQRAGGSGAPTPGAQQDLVPTTSDASGRENEIVAIADELREFNLDRSV